MYTLIDPPVNAYSRPEQISAWIDELRGWVALPEFQHADNRKRLDAALAQAQSWLERSRSMAARQHPPDRPAV